MCAGLALLSIINPDSRSSLQKELKKCKNSGGKAPKVNGPVVLNARGTGKVSSADTGGGRGNQRNGTRTNFGKLSVRKKTGKGYTGKGNKDALVAGASSAGKKPGRVNGSALVAGSAQNELANHQLLHPVEGRSETSGPGGRKSESGKGKKRRNKKTRMPRRQQTVDSGQQIADGGQPADYGVSAASTYSAVPSLRSKRQSDATAPVCVNERNIIEKLKENPRGHFIQTEDIDMEKAEIAAGLYSTRNEVSPAEGLPEFRGTYDGGGHRLHHIHSNPGLFNRLNGAVIKHVDLINNNNAIMLGQAYGGLEAGLLAGESDDSTFIDISLHVAVINRGRLEFRGVEADAEPHSGALVGRSDSSVFEGIRTTGVSVGNDNHPASGALVGSGDNNRFSNIYLSGYGVRGEELGSIIGSGNNNTIDGCVIDSRNPDNPTLLVGSGNGTSVSRCLIIGKNPPYFPEGTVADEVIGYRRLSDPAIFSIGTFSDTNWRLDHGLVPVPRMQDKNINIVREKFRAWDAPPCSRLACPPPVASDCRQPTEEMYEGQVQDFLSFDDKNIYLLVKEGNNTADHLKYMPGNNTCSGDDTGSGSGFGFGSGNNASYGNDTSYGNACPGNSTISDNTGDDNACGTDRLKSDGCAVNQLSYLSRGGVTVHDTVKNNDNGRIYLIWKRTHTEGHNAYLARYGDDGKFIDVLEAGYGHVFNGENFSLQYRNNRTVLVSTNQAFVIVGEGSSPVELPAHPSLVSYAYGKAIIDENNSIYILADSRTEEGGFRSLIKYSENNSGEYEIDPFFVVQSQFTPNDLQFSTQQSPRSAGIPVDDDIWVINQDQTGLHIRSVNRMSGGDSGIVIDQYVTEPSQYALRLANDEVQLAYVDGEEVIWHSYNRQGKLIDSEAVRLDQEVSVSALKFKDIAEDDPGETIYIGGVNTTDNRPYSSRFTTYRPGERPVTQNAETTAEAETTADYFTTATPDSTTATPDSTTGTPASNTGTPASNTGTPGDTPTTPGSTSHTDIIGGATSVTVGIGLCVVCGVGSGVCCKKYIKKRKLMRRVAQAPTHISTGSMKLDTVKKINFDAGTDKKKDAGAYMMIETALDMENQYETAGPPTGSEIGQGHNMTDEDEAKLP